MTHAQRLYYIALTQCAATLVGEHSQAETMGEGYSATTEQPARYTYRAFTVPDFPRICRAAPSASRIKFAKTTMTLRVGDTFDLADLPSAIAFDADGTVANALPVYINRTSGEESVDWSGQDQKWHVVAPGEVSVTVSGACKQHENLRASLTIVIPAPSAKESSRGCDYVSPSKVPLLRQNVQFAVLGQQVLRPTRGHGARADPRTPSRAASAGLWVPTR